MALSKEFRNKIELRFGQTIRYPKDCESLAKHITQVTKDPISSSTIKRLFGLIKNTNKLSPETMKVIGKYLESTEWQEPDDQLIDPNFVEGLSGTVVPSHCKSHNQLTLLNKERKYARLKVEIFIGLTGILLLWVIFYLVSRH